MRCPTVLLRGECQLSRLDWVTYALWTIAGGEIILGSIASVSQCEQYAPTCCWGKKAEGAYKVATPTQERIAGGPAGYVYLRSRTAPCGTDWEIRSTTGGRKPATAGRSLTSRGFSLPDGHGKCPSLAPVLFELADTPAAVSQGGRPRRSSLMGSPIAQFPAAARDWPPGNVPGVGAVVSGQWSVVGGQ